MIIKGNADIFVVTESKLDDTFPSQQFAMDGYIQFRSDRNADGGGVLIYVKQDIPCREITSYSIEMNFKGIFFRDKS